MVYRRFVQLFEMIRKRMPGVPVLFISLKPSPSRWHLRDKMIRANKLIKGFLRWKHNAGFIDVYHRMLEEHGSPVPELFLPDRLHMNAMGYDIWKRAIEPHLKK
jgi:lysophospholipase L1-like esterase